MERNRRKRDTPEAVTDSYEQLKIKLGANLSLKKIKGHNYLYRQLIEWDKERRKYICRESKYLGKIEDNGRFVPKAVAGKDDIEVAKAVIAAHGGTVVLPNPEVPEVPQQTKRMIFSELDLGLLMDLTMDGRMRPNAIAEKRGTNARGIGYKIGSLEKKLMLEYVPHIIIDKLGYSWFIVLVKFLEDKPDSGKVKEGLEQIPNVQFGAMTNGKYDMMLYVAAENDHDFVDILAKMKMIPAFDKLRSEWYISYMFMTKGFIPIRDSFFEVLEKNKIWNRKMGSRTAFSGKLSKNEYQMLRLLNKDGKVSFAEMERGISIATGSANYIYDKLKADGVLNIISINMTNLNILYNAVIMMDLIDRTEYLKTRIDLLKFINDEENGFLTNRFCLTGDVGIPDGGLFILPIMKEGQLEKIQKELEKKIKGVRLSSFIITDILCGKFIYHRFDSTMSSQYRIIEEQSRLK